MAVLQIGRASNVRWRPCRPRWNPRQIAAFKPQMTEEALGLYYASRELSERAMSRTVSDRRAAAAHAEMADRYEALATVFGAKRLTQIPADYL